MLLRVPPYWLALCLVLFSKLTSAQCQSPDAASNPIKLGMSTALSGPAQYLGQSMRDGVMAYLSKVNCNGGANQQLFELVVRDDGYQPGSALSNMEKLILEDGVLAVVGNVGTPTAKVAMPFAQSNNTVFYGAYTGASILRKTPPDPYVFNFRASYRQELDAIIQHILHSGIKPSRIAFFIQDDAYGQAGYYAAMQVLKQKGFTWAEQLLVTRYQRNTLQVDTAIIDMLDMPKPPKAVIIVGAYAASAKFINYSHNLFPDTLYYNLSFAGATALGESLDIASNRVFVSQVVPYLGNGLALSKEFKRDMHAHVPEGRVNEISFEGYIVAKILHQSLQQYGAVEGRDDIKAALQQLGTLDIGLGSELYLGQGQQQASQQVWLMQYQRGKGFSKKVERFND